MKHFVSELFALAFVALSVRAQGQPYAQCGGIGWTGATTCVSGWSCVSSSQWFSQCLPATSTTTTATSTSTTVSSTTKTSASTTTTTGPTATGFVKTSGQRFTLNGSKYTVVGANAYWVSTFGLSDADMNTTFSNIAAAGGTTVRTLGFNDVTSPITGVYYQSWSGATATVNTGANGLGNFDRVVASAKAHGIRLIITLTNNWSDYGGMDVYTTQITGSPNHDVFYTNAAVISAYKNYVKTFVGRYVNEPTVMAWELANEPRCRGTTGVTSGTCTPATVNAWAANISAYIKSIDPNHLVALGDEGFYNQPTAPTYPYQGTEGIDFDLNLKIATLDFGTFHSYPIGYGQNTDPTGWGTQWIKDHATSGKAVNKPVIMEEFGVTDDALQQTAYPIWYSTVESSGIAGDLIWQAGSQLSIGPSPDDGYAIYTTDPIYALEKTHNAKMKAAA